jgi:hypothetical protein
MKKVRIFESRKGVQKEEKMKRNMFCELESLFFFLLFFHYSFPFALQKLFLELEVALP